MKLSPDMKCFLTPVIKFNQLRATSFTKFPVFVVLFGILMFFLIVSITAESSSLIIFAFLHILETLDVLCQKLQLLGLGTLKNSVYFIQ